MNIKHLRKAAKLTQQQLATRLSVIRSTVAMWESEKSQPDNNALINMSKIFDVPIDEILENDKKNAVKIPVLGCVAAGIPIEAVEDIIGYEEIPESMSKKGDFFGLRIKGNSMEPQICDGDIVIVRKQEDVESGEIAIVIVNGDEGVCKKVIKHENGISLVSLNPLYDPMFFSPNEVEEKPVTICGKVVELRRKF